jgi:hypothetical protein
MAKVFRSIGLFGLMFLLGVAAYVGYHSMRTPTVHRTVNQQTPTKVATALSPAEKASLLHVLSANDKGLNRRLRATAFFSGMAAQAGKESVGPISDAAFFQAEQLWRRAWPDASFDEVMHVLTDRPCSVVKVIPKQDMKVPLPPYQCPGILFDGIQWELNHRENSKLNR